METNELKAIKKVCDLIKKTSPNKFHKQDKINFAYNYWNITDEDITDLYSYLAQNKSKENEKLARLIGDFVDSQKITHYRKFSHDFYNYDLQDILKAGINTKENGNWLSKYDLNREFTQRSTHSSPIIYSYLIQDNKITIDREKAGTILGILTENNIPTAKIIVTSSFPYYAHDDINTYIESFQKIK